MQEYNSEKAYIQRKTPSQWLAAKGFLVVIVI